LVSLYNLADFAKDDDVRLSARMVLEFALAKFALASRDGIRVAPYRRLVGAMKYTSTINLVNAADHPLALMLLYAGQTQRLPEFPPTLTRPGHMLASNGAPSAMIYAATSSFLPDSDIVDLVIDKRARWFQRIRNGGIEIYTSTRSFTLAAGGIKAPPAATLQFGPFPTPFDRATDQGTGVPTSLIPSGSKDVDRLAFMRFEGVRKEEGDGWTYDHNTCVWQGFACGINYFDSWNMGGCFQPGLDNAPAEWSFFDSKQCGMYANAPPFFIARYLLPCTNRDSGCVEGGRFGFFEAVDAPSVDFDTFRREVVARNPVIFPGNPPPFGHYHMFAGNHEHLLFSPIAHKIDPKLAGVLFVNFQSMPRIPDWPLAEGDVLNSSGDGVVIFRNPGNFQTIVWDFSDAQHPKRTPP
jgi:hypothetical protein